MQREGIAPLPMVTLLIAGLLWLPATGVPLMLWRLSPPFIDSTYGGGHQPFELLGMFLSLLALGMAGWWVIRSKPDHPTKWLTIGLWLMPTLWAIQQVAEYAQPSWDWKCYVSAAEAVAAGGTPYTDCYVYPPLFAQLLAGAYPGFHWLGETLKMMAPKHWMVGFFFWHSFQVLMVSLLTVLLVRLARREGLSALMAAGLVAALLVVDTPLQRTIRHNQVNLLVLNVVLIAADRVAVRPMVSAVLVAVAAHIKLLPAVLFAVLGMQRKWAAASVGVLLALAVAAMQQWGAEPLGLWTQYFSYAPQFVQGEYFRDNSPTSLIFNLVRVPVDWLGGNVTDWLEPLRLLGMLAGFALGGWVVLGMRQRPDTDKMWAEGLALTLVLSPVSWEHHYVWALPLAVIVVARCGTVRPGLVWGALILVFGLPTFDVFPISYHRLLGLLMLFSLVRASVPAETASR